jgi:hypothetical protein
MKLENAFPKTAQLFAFLGAIASVVEAAPDAKAAPSGKVAQDSAPAPTKSTRARAASETAKSVPAATPSKAVTPAAANSLAKATKDSKNSPSSVTSAPMKGATAPVATQSIQPRIPHKAVRAATSSSSPGEKSASANSSEMNAVLESIASLRAEVAQMHAYDNAVVGQPPPVQKVGPSQEQLERMATLTTDRATVEAKLAKLETAVASGAVEVDAVAPSFDVLRARLAQITAEQDRMSQQKVVASDKPHPVLQRLQELETKMTELQAHATAPQKNEPVLVPAPATDAPAAPAASTASAAPARPVLTWDGLVDSHALWNFTTSPSTAGQKYRAFDTRSNSFTLSYAKLGSQLDVGPASLRMDLGYGHTGAIVNQSSGSASAASATDTLGASLYGSAFLMEQAYAEVRLGTRFVLDAGRFLTSAGAEVIEAPKNWLYSRSLLFYGQPLLHTGVRLNFKAHDQLTIQASVVNGWNNDPSPKGDKTYGISLTYTPSAATNVIATTYVGRYAVFNNAAPPNDDVQVLADLVIGHNVCDTLALNLNLDYYAAGSTHWYGASVMGRYVLAPKLVLAVRGELLRSKLAYANELGNNGYLAEGTFMLGVPLSPNYELRIEGRVDGANESVFVADANRQHRSQATGLVGFLAFF